MLCESSQVESETHFLLHCNFYADLRRDLFGRCNKVIENFSSLSDFSKMIILMNNNSTIHHVAKCVHAMYSRRKQHI